MFAGFIKREKHNGIEWTRVDEVAKMQSKFKHAKKYETSTQCFIKEKVYTKHLKN